MKIESSLLVKNAALNFAGQLAPLLVGVATIPYIVRSLGAERFGIFSLAFVVVGHFAIFELGLGRATTKFVAEALARGQTDKIEAIVGTSLTFVAVSSVTAGVILIILTPVLVERVLNVPFYLAWEAKSVFYIAAVSMLFTLTTGTLSGVLEAYQRFDLVNALKVPSSMLSYIIPAVAVFFGGGLLIIVLLLVLKSFCVLLVYYYLSLKVMPSKKTCFAVDLALARSLFSFGGWIALHNGAVAVLLYLDRFLVGVFLTMAAVTYYTAAYELMSRSLIIPSSMMMVLFPTFSTLEVTDKEKLQNLFIESLKYLTLTMGLIAGFICVFSREILFVWLGEDFATKSTMVLQVFAIGVFLSSLAWLTGTLLQSIGKPRVVTIIHVLQVPLYILSTWALIKTMNIEGAALSWTARVLVSLVVLLFGCSRVGLFKPALLVQSGAFELAVVIGIISGITIVVKSFAPFSLLNVAGVFSVYVMSALVIIWKYVLKPENRVFIVRTRDGFNCESK